MLAWRDTWTNWKSKSSLPVHSWKSSTRFARSILLRRLLMQQCTVGSFRLGASVKRQWLPKSTGVIAMQSWRTTLVRLSTPALANWLVDPDWFLQLSIRGMRAPMLMESVPLDSNLVMTASDRDSLSMTCSSRCTLCNKLCHTACGCFRMARNKGKRIHASVCRSWANALYDVGLSRMKNRCVPLLCSLCLQDSTLTVYNYVLMNCPFCDRRACTDGMENWYVDIEQSDANISLICFCCCLTLGDLDNTLLFL